VWLALPISVFWRTPRSLPLTGLLAAPFFVEWLAAILPQGLVEIEQSGLHNCIAEERGGVGHEYGRVSLCQGVG